MGNSLVQSSSSSSSSSTARAESVIGRNYCCCLSSLNLVVESLISRYGEIKWIKTEATTHWDLCSVVSLSVARNQRELLVVIIILLNELPLLHWPTEFTCCSLPGLLLLFKSPKGSSPRHHNQNGRLCGDSYEKMGRRRGRSISYIPRCVRTRQR